jgi:glycosyltransferase involved in cell wall biosynthesis
MKRLLFITWDGPQVNYLEGLFYPILRGLKGSYAVDVVQFTWGDREKSEKAARLLEGAGMHYTRVEIGARVWTLLKGTFYLRSRFRKQNYDVVMYRSIYPGLMILPWSGGKTKWVFDADGLPLEEKVDFGGMNPNGPFFRVLKWVEGAAVRKADRVLVRSARALDALPPGPGKFRVVLNGRDSSVYQLPEEVQRRTLRASIGVSEDELLLVYSGSLGPQYCVPEMLQLLDVLNEEHKARLLVLTGSPDYLHSFDEGARAKLLVFNLPATEVPRYLGAADAALAIRKGSPSMRAVSPVKLGEYLMCGLPVVATADIGDTRELLRGRNACLLLEDHTTASIRQAAHWVTLVSGNKEIQQEARRLGLEKFSLEESIATYQKALEG